MSDIQDLYYAGDGAFDRAQAAYDAQLPAWVDAEDSDEEWPDEAEGLHE